MHSSRPNENGVRSESIPVTDEETVIDRAVAAWSGTEPRSPYRLRNALVAYGFAASAVLAAAIVRTLLAPVFANRAAFMPYFAAVLITAWLGGWRPGAAALVMSMGAVSAFQSTTSGPGGVPEPLTVLAVLPFVIGTSGTMAIIETLHRARSRAADASRRSISILESISDGFVQIDADWRCTYANAVAERLLRKTRSELLNQDLRLLYVDAAAIIDKVSTAMRDRRPISTVEYYAPFDLWIELNAYPNTAGVSVFFRDITARTKAEAERTRYIREIETLNQRLQHSMSETHHRIKNNLQIITALVDMHRVDSDDASRAPDLDRLMQHIRSLAIIHDVLTNQARTDPLAEKISVKHALGKLVPMIQTIVHERNITLESEDAQLDVRLANDLAVLVNELVSNAVKHGDGDIEVSFTSEKGLAKLSVCDNGAGFPIGFSAAYGHTGLELIEALAGWDLSGRVLYDNRPEGGARVVVEFPLQTATVIARPTAVVSGAERA